MRFFCAGILGDLLTDPKHSLRSRGQLSSCMTYPLRCSVRRRLTITAKSLFLELPVKQFKRGLNCKESRLDAGRKRCLASI